MERLSGVRRLRCDIVAVEVTVDPRLELAGGRHGGGIEQPHDARIRAQLGENVVEEQGVLVDG